MDSQYIDTIKDDDTDIITHIDDDTNVDTNLVADKNVVNAVDDDIDNSEIINVNDSGGILYDILHVMDDIYVYGRSIIENNYFNN